MQEVEQRPGSAKPIGTQTLRRSRMAAFAVMAMVPVMAAACGSSPITSTISPAAPSPATTSAAAVGANIKDLQRDLATVGCYTGAVDGSLGSQTTQAIRSFQSAAGLSVDGLYGPATQARLLAATHADTKVCSASGSTTTTSKPSDTTTTTASSTTTTGATAPCTSAAIGAALASGETVQGFQCSGGWAAGGQTNRLTASAFLLQSDNGKWFQAPADACANAAALGIPPAVLAVSYCNVS